MVDYRVFDAKAPGVIAMLLGDFPEWRADDAIADVGNLGHECLGFTELEEINPTVKGSRGGFGWPQWTGPRRRAYEAYCKRNNLDPKSDKANYAYHFIELKGSERATIGKVARAQGLYAKVKAFELGYLRAGIKNYDSRDEWAMRAKAVYQGAGSPVQGTPPAEQVVLLGDESKAATGRGNVAIGTASAGAVGGGSGAAVAAPDVHGLVDWLLLGGFGAIVVGVVIYCVVRGLREHRTAAALKAAAFDIAIKGSK